ncbi:guanine deaminase [Granulibacter bethesdensis]|uniref:guanine deaminase n=2 Tax=Granulibacter bethesdensis TaxID=364410 RepID=UPI0003016845|nr:guanine deaminase [Granulibacter bethesdensis]
MIEKIMSKQGFLHAVRGEIISVPHHPQHHGNAAIRHDPDGMLVFENGIIIARGPYAIVAEQFSDVPVTHYPGKLIIPGLIDTHVHYPQTGCIASHGSQLLEWLNRYVFPEEMKFSDPAYAQSSAEFFLDELLRNGTTTALVFATVHTTSVDALFAAASTRNMRIISGKVLMDLGPEHLHDTVETAHDDTHRLIKRWHGCNRLGYAIVPRYALSCTDAQLHLAADLLGAYPDTLFHTHLAESVAECSAVAERFPPQAGYRDYLDVYARFGLLTARSVFAHGVQLDARAFQALAEAQAGIAFCPTSNSFLGSGLFDLQQAEQHGVGIGLGTDIGAGTSFSLLHTMGAAYQTGQLRGTSLDPFTALYLATAGGASILGLRDRIGALEEGQEADFVVLDPAATPLLARRTQGHSPGGHSLADRLFALQILGDDRAVVETYIAGCPSRPGQAASRAST